MGRSAKIPKANGKVQVSNRSYNFKDLGYTGPDFTWCNIQEGDDKIYLRLDKALATQNWIEKYKEVRVHYIVHSISDHFALLVSDSFSP